MTPQHTLLSLRPTLGEKNKKRKKPVSSVSIRRTTTMMRGTGQGDAAGVAFARELGHCANSATRLPRRKARAFTAKVDDTECEVLERDE